MKKIIFLLLTLVPFIAFGQKAKIEFEKTSHDFGTISETGGKAVYDFKFKNTGTAPLILNNVRAGCGCTTPEWDRKPVAPGESGIIKVSYDPIGRPGSFTKSITVNSNAATSVTTLTIRGNVSRKPADPYDAYKFNIDKLKIESNNLNLGNIKKTQEIEKDIEIINSGDKPLSITVTPPKHITATVAPATLNKGEKGKIHIKYIAAQKNDWGFVSDKLNVKINNSEQGEITVVATIEEDFSQYTEETMGNAPVAEFSEENIHLGDINKNTTQTHEFYIQNNGKSELVIRKLKPSDESVSVNVAKSVIKPGKKIKVTTSFKTDDTNGKKIKLIQFTLNDPKSPLFTYKITANVL